MIRATERDMVLNTNQDCVNVPFKMVLKFIYINSQNKVLTIYHLLYTDSKNPTAIEKLRLLHSEA